MTKANDDFLQVVNGEPVGPVKGPSTPSLRRLQTVALATAPRPRHKVSSAVWLDRRASVRHGVDALVTINLAGAQQLDLPKERAARLVNLSHGGAHIVCSQLPGIIGDRIQVDLPGFHQDPITLTGNIVGIKPRGESFWAVSLRFLSPTAIAARQLQRVIRLFEGS